MAPACAWLTGTTRAPCARPPAYAVELATAAGVPLPLHACAVHVGALIRRGFANPIITRALVTRTDADVRPAA